MAAGIVLLYLAYRLAHRARRQPIPTIEPNDWTPRIRRAPSREAHGINHLADPVIVPETPRNLVPITPMTVPNAPMNDHLVIDLTGNQAVSIPLADGLTKSPHPVPTWAHQYIFSARELDSAEQRQKDFYYAFRNAFVRGTNYDIEGNTNYAFILLFDLVGTSGVTADHATVERHLTRLGEFYPKTKPYLWSSLAKHLEQAGFSEEANRIGATRQADSYRAANYDQDYWRYGSRHKKRLRLTADDVKILNRLSHQSNNFLAIQFCEDQVIRVFLAVVKELDGGYRSEGSELEKQLTAIADVVARRELRYRAGSRNYEYAISWIGDEILHVLFKHCENAVREHVGHKRKLGTEWFHETEAKTELQSRILDRLPPIVSAAISKTSRADREVEIELNKQNPTRWKSVLEQLKADEGLSGEAFVKAVNELGDLNIYNPSLEMIFFDASKFMAEVDKQAALTLYIYYLYHDLHSVKFDNRKMTKTVQKSLFPTKDKLHEFEYVVSDLTASCSLEAALAAITNFYVPKRRHIKLNSTEIKQAKVKDADTVELLNEYLQDEFEDEQSVIVASQKNNDELILEIAVKSPPSRTDGDEILELATGCEAETAVHTSVCSSFSAMHRDLLTLFAQNGFLLGQDEVETFAKQNGAFRNQLVESINDACYNLIEDVLIEEDGEDYTILESYYRAVISQ
jgi:hypothetical protein